MRRREMLWLSVIVVLVVLQAAPAANKADGNYDQYKRFVQVLEQVKQHYWTAVDEDELFLGAYKGMLAELDPYSQYMTAEDIEQLTVDTEGEFGGLGIEITLDKNNILTVITPIEDTPAMRAGVLPGDRIVEIEGENTYNMRLIDAVKRLRGKAGTQVTITVVHENPRAREKLTITRDIIKVKSVRAGKMVDEKAKIGYVRMSNFQKTTPEELQDAVQKLLDQGMKGLVLDLRRNPGGLLDSAVKVTDLFIDDGVIVSTKGRTPDSAHRFPAHKKGTFSDFPLAILVSGFSASGSEIVAGAVQDHRRGILVGARTFGKGSVQSILSLDGGAKLRLTTAKYYTPNGRMIHRTRKAKEDDPWGIMPDIEVKTTPEEELGLIVHWRDERISENVKNGLEPKPEEPKPEAPKPEAPEPEKNGKGDAKKEFVDRTLVSAIDALKAVLVYGAR